MEAVEVPEWMTRAVAHGAELAEKYPDHEAFVQDLALRSGLANMNGTPPGWRYGSYQDLVFDLTTGIKVAPPALPEGYELMEERNCFHNSWSLVQDNPNLLYVEGYALANFMPTEHAWVETLDGTIIDPTWARFTDLEQITYMGVRFDPEVAILLSIESGWTSVFGGDASVLDNRALRHGFPTNDGIVIGTNHDPQENP